MKSLAIIPARGGSKGILRKNIKPLVDIPLIQYTIVAALKSRVDTVVVSTEDEEIAEFSKSLDCEVVMRPAELAEDNTATLPVIQHVVSSFEEQYEFILTLQPTSPFRNYLHINKALTLIEADDLADSVVSVIKVPHNFSESKQMQMKNGYLEGNTNVLRRQDVAESYARNGAGIYITRSNRIGEFIFGGNILPFEMNQIESIDIDTVEDWTIAEALIMSNADLVDSDL